MLSEILISFIVAVVLAAALTAILAWRTPGKKEIWPPALYFFAILFFSAWAGGVWMTPVGPEHMGVQWVPFVLTAVFVGILIIAVLPPPTQRLIERDKVAKANDRNFDVAEFERKQRSPTSGFTLGVGFFYFVFLLLVVTAILIHYLIMEA